jgi:dienelactone hydrolase
MRETSTEAAGEPGTGSSPTLLGRIKTWFSRLLIGPRAWMGATIGALLAGVVAAWAGIDGPIGFGSRTDRGLEIGIAAVAVAACTAVALLIAWLVRKVPLKVIAAVIGGFGAIVIFPLLLEGQVFAPVVLIIGEIIPLEMLFGLSLGAILGGELSGASRTMKAVIGTLFVLTLAANIYFVIVLSGRGSDGYLVAFQSSPATGSLSQAKNPGERGTFAVKKLVYGSGDATRRPEFAGSVDARSEPVDATKLLPFLKGFRNTARKWFWAFDPTRLPINGTVWMPEGPGPFPLVLVVHGNHDMEEFSDPGYAYLGEHLASRGFITVSVDENFLNGTWSGDMHGKELPARGWFLLEHLKQWKAWNSKSGNPFFGKVDLDRIALVGHSRGGEAAAVAAAFNRLSRYPEDGRVAFDFRFGIRGVVAFAPSDSFYKPDGEPLRLTNVDYLVIQGAHDADVAKFMGSSQYQRVKFTGTDLHFKSAIYVDRANHGQFNTVWGENDMSGPLHAIQNVKPLISGEDQRSIAKVYLAAFCETVLHNDKSYLPIFRDPRLASQWLPAARYAARFRDSAFQVVSDFEEDIDLETTTLAGGTESAHEMDEWREERVLLRDGSRDDNHAVFLKWKTAEDASEADKTPKPAEYRINLPADLAKKVTIEPTTCLRFALARAQESDEPLEIELRLESSDGKSAQLPLEPIGPPIRIRITKLLVEPLLLTPYEIVFQTYEIPLSKFRQANPAFASTKLARISFVFNRKQADAVYLDDIGLARSTSEAK